MVGGCSRAGWLVVVVSVGGWWLLHGWVVGDCNIGGWLVVVEGVDGWWL